MTLASVQTGRIRDLVAAAGQSAWLDAISRQLLDSGEFERMVREDGLSGVTSNPSIFEKAIAGSSDYDEAIAAAAAKTTDVKAVYEALAIGDLRDAADILRDVFDDTGGADGYVSMEVSPGLAYDTDGTIAEAQRLWKALDRPNVMIKVPGTAEGLPAIRQLISDGINVNVTLLFSKTVYADVVEAYMSGLGERAARGDEISGIASVASFFISRIDGAVDPKISEPFQGKVAIANGKVTYELFQELHSGSRWEALAAQGARAQRVLWASTSTKNPAYPDLLYVEALIGPDTVDTLPPETYEALKDHGTIRTTLTEDVPAAKELLAALPAEGVNLDEVTDTLVREGVEKFVDAERGVLASVSESISKIAG